MAADGIDHLALKKAHFKADRDAWEAYKTQRWATVFEQSAEVYVAAPTVVLGADSDTFIDSTTGEIVPREQDLAIDNELPSEESEAMPYDVAFIESCDEQFAQHEAFYDPGRMPIFDPYTYELVEVVTKQCPVVGSVRAA